MQQLSLFDDMGGALAQGEAGVLPPRRKARVPLSEDNKPKLNLKILPGFGAAPQKLPYLSPSVITVTPMTANDLKALTRIDDFMCLRNRCPLWLHPCF